ncbi:MAG: biopolymer transporter ExbD [Planctomycetes bacterium]|nr:biopolymer transporter ExbD [Planctomycetota bacterium]
MAHKPKKHKEIKDDDVDLNPLIDVITMLIIFFILGGKMSSDIRTEQITVPPTRTATKLDADKGWERIVVNVFGTTQNRAGESKPVQKIRIGTKEFTAEGVDNYSAYIGMRELLDRAYERAEKKPDTKGTGLMLPMVVLEIRADADTQYRVVQEIQQIVADSVDPRNNMLPKQQTTADAKPFVNINFTTRLPGDGK